MVTIIENGKPVCLDICVHFFLQYAHMRKLLWQDIAPQSALHAVLVAGRGRGFQAQAHTHDFYEMFFVQAGAMRHEINEETHIVQAGELWFLHPEDTHSIRYILGRILHYTNVAFPANLYQAFCHAAGLPLSPPYTHVTIAPAEQHVVQEAFRIALDVYTKNDAQTLELFRFLGNTLGHFRPTLASPTAYENFPDWLVLTCEEFVQNAESLRIGLPSLQQTAPVSAGHLARVLKASTGQSPTEWINEKRLARSATLLATTALPILDIALECGFVQLSYFYRLFKNHYHLSPARYRQQAYAPVAPV
jgi:AraC family transcriptional regulator, dual regulator of chb operon